MWCVYVCVCVCCVCVCVVVVVVVVVADAYIDANAYIDGDVYTSANIFPQNRPAANTGSMQTRTYVPADLRNDRQATLSELYLFFFWLLWSV